jgi:hypothetical protein
MNLRVSPNGRFLMYDDGTPFFWLADTGWTILQRLNRDETLEYLDDRAAKGFNIIQTMGITEFDALRVPNAFGETPFLDMNPATPNDKYWQHVDWVIEEAAKRKMLLALLPIWGDKVNRGWGVGPEILTPENARLYGQWLGKRYRDAPLIWVVGGDRRVENERHLETWRALAQGLKNGDDAKHLMTFHPPGGHSSSFWYHDDEWLDINMWQTGHHISGYINNYERIAQDYARQPVKPVLDGEPCYEDHPIMIDDGETYRRSDVLFNDFHARRAIYTGVFAGACGHTYGANGVFQCFVPEMRDPEKYARWGLDPAIKTIRPDEFHSRFDWRESLQFPGAHQMQHAKNLMLSRPYFERIPDQNLIRSENAGGMTYVAATRAQDSSYAMIYFPCAQTVELDLSPLAPRLRAWWFDPRSGEAQLLGEYSNGVHSFSSFYSGPDWVLVLDDVSRDFGAPGRL